MNSDQRLAPVPATEKWKQSPTSKHRTFFGPMTLEVTPPEINDAAYFGSLTALPLIPMYAFRPINAEDWITQPAMFRTTTPEDDEALPMHRTKLPQQGHSSSPQEEGLISLPTSSSESPLSASLLDFEPFDETPDAFGVPELFENIVHYLPIHDILRLRQVNAHWHKQIHGASFIRKAAFLAPANAIDSKELHHRPAAVVTFRPGVGLNNFTMQGNHTSSIYIINSALFISKPFGITQETVLPLAVSPLAVLHPSDARLDMYVTQPPVTCIKVKSVFAEAGVHNGQREEWDFELHEATGVKFCQVVEKFRHLAGPIRYGKGRWEVDLEKSVVTVLGKEGC